MAHSVSLKGIRVALMALCCAVSACDSGSFSAGVAAPNAKSMGFVWANGDFLLNLREDPKLACPKGRNPTNRKNWEAQFPTQTERQRHLNRCGDIRNRGPNCENVWFNPEVIEDPLPFRAVQGRIADGANLDGVTDGRAMENTCAHEEFISPDGEPGIDNQYYRWSGCHDLDATNFEEAARRVIRQRQHNRLLLEITGVNDERNDDSVKVAMYRGRDELIVDAAGKAVPWQSQRIDEGPLELIFALRGKIVDGVLMTEPADARLDKLFIRGMAFRLKITPTGAEGIRLGYVDVDSFWQGYSRSASHYGTIVGASGPSAYAALRRFADGYKDPKTGACTALSSAQKYEFVRAHVIRSS